MAIVRIRSVSGLGLGPMPVAFQPSASNITQTGGPSLIASSAASATSAAFRAQRGTTVPSPLRKGGKAAAASPSRGAAVRAAMASKGGARTTTSTFGPLIDTRPKTPVEQARIEQAAAQERAAAQNLETELDFQQETTDANVDQDSANADVAITTDDATGGDIVDDGSGDLPACPPGQARNAAQVCVPIVGASQPQAGMSTGAKIAIAGGIGVLAIGAYFLFR